VIFFKSLHIGILLQLMFAKQLIFSIVSYWF